MNASVTELCVGVASNKFGAPGGVDEQENNPEDPLELEDPELEPEFDVAVGVGVAVGVVDPVGVEVIVPVGVAVGVFVGVGVLVAVGVGVSANASKAPESAADP